MVDMSHNDDLIDELREARKKERKKFQEWIDERAILREKQAAHQAAADLVEEILKEIETGDSGRPIMDAINGKGNGKPDLPLSPMDEHQALARALRVEKVREKLLDLTVSGATDDQILAELWRWPTHRERPTGNMPGCSWAVVGAPAPRFYAGHAAETFWPMAEGVGILSGTELARAVRKSLKIPQPKKNTAAVPGPIPELDQLAGEGLVAKDVTLRPAGAVDVTTAAIDAKLKEALGWLDVGSRLALMDPSPSDGTICAELDHAWTNVKPSQTPGYRVAARPGPRFWLGNVMMAIIEPTLKGADLVAAVRRVLHLAAPAYEKPKKARGKAAAAEVG